MLSLLLRKFLLTESEKVKQLLELIQDKNYLPTKAAAEELLFHARELASSWGYEIDENLPKS